MAGWRSTIKICVRPDMLHLRPSQKSQECLILAELPHAQMGQRDGPFVIANGRLLADLGPTGIAYIRFL